jgi:pimeloyl-ACP methyl ester carboxylesterase
VSLLENAICDRAPGRSEDKLALVMLPGAKNTPAQLVEHGFIRAMRERNLPADVMALDTHADYYLERGRIERRLHETLDAVKVQGYRRIWLMGISLGGLGSMLCATQRTADIEGVLLLAPFLGTRGVIAEVAKAGGLLGWQAQDDGDHERAFLARLQASLFHEPQFPRIYLGYGCDDHYMAASELLAECLPPQRVLSIGGGHDWETWRRLWEGLLDKSPFSLP